MPRLFRESPLNGVWAGAADSHYTSNAPSLALNPTLGSPAGGNQPHDNLMPYQAVNFIISLFGIYPTQN
jgi:microcystin-dependent protein